MIYYGNELYHYGTPGQKWGKRNYQNEDGSYTPEGQAENNGHGRYSNVDGDSNRKSTGHYKLTSRKSSHSSRKSRNQSKNNGHGKYSNTDEDNKGFHLTEQQKKYIKIGVGVTAGLLAAYGGYRLYKSGVIGDWINSGKNILEDDILDSQSDFVPHSLQENSGTFKSFNMADFLAENLGYDEEDSKDFIEGYRQQFDSLKQHYSELSLIPKGNYNIDDILNNKISLKEVIKNNNDGIWAKNGYDSFEKIREAVISGNTRDLQNSTLGRNLNCMLCTSNLAMKMKGYDSIANSSPGAYAISQIEDWFSNAKTELYTASSKTIFPDSNKVKNEVLSRLISQGNGHYGQLGITLNGEYGNGGHSVFYLVKDSAVHILDGQMELEWDNDTLFDNIYGKYVYITDLTNCEPTEKILKAIM